MRFLKRDAVKLRRWQGKVGTDGRRPSVYVGRCTDPGYGTIKGHLVALSRAKRTGGEVSESTAAFLASVGNDFHERIARAGLCKSRVCNSPSGQPVAKYIAAHIAGRVERGIGSRNLLNLRQTESKLLAFFGPSKSITSVTTGDAKAFRQWLEGEEFAQATISMHIKKARQFFGAVVDDEILTRNPFRGVKAGTQSNAAKMRYLTAATIEKLIVVADTKYQLILALARYGGLRCPSEVGRVRKCDVDLATHQLRVMSDKTKKQGKPERTIPIHPRLGQILRGVMDALKDDQAKLVADVDCSANLRTHIHRLCKRAGIEKYPKPLQNLRVSCETDWMDTDGPALACKWSGNTYDVAMKHYHLVRDSDYKRAAERGAGSGAERCRNEGNGTDTVQTQTPASVGISPAYLPVPFSSLAGVPQIVPPRGVEPLFAG